MTAHYEEKYFYLARYMNGGALSLKKRSFLRLKGIVKPLKEPSFARYTHSVVGFFLNYNVGCATINEG